MPPHLQALPQVNGRKNLLLGSLDSDVYGRLASRLELTPMTRGEIVCPPGQKLTHAYFPVSGIISLLHVLEDGSTGESAVIGNEGMLGVAILTGAYAMSSEATVQNEGYAFKLPAEALMDEFNRSTSTRNRLLRYTQALLAQTSQTAICNRHHTVQQQLCRRLLLTLDRLPGDELHMTQEQIASTLGVRREGISEAAGRLQLAGLITYKRGRITVLDRDRLEDHACECYHVVKDECDRLENLPLPSRKHLPYSVERRRRVRPPPPGNH
ncbi:MAG: Crp/Fnr family transcriptional regulator [Wenzhouxiangella sp.]